MSVKYIMTELGKSIICSLFFYIYFELFMKWETWDFHNHNTNLSMQVQFFEGMICAFVIGRALFKRKQSRVARNLIFLLLLVSGLFILISKYLREVESYQVFISMLSFLHVLGFLLFMVLCKPEKVLVISGILGLLFSQKNNTGVNHNKSWILRQFLETSDQLGDSPRDRSSVRKEVEKVFISKANRSKWKISFFDLGLALPEQRLLVKINSHLQKFFFESSAQRVIFNMIFLGVVIALCRLNNILIMFSFVKIACLFVLWAVSLVVYVVRRGKHEIGRRGFSVVRILQLSVCGLLLYSINQYEIQILTLLILSKLSFQKYISFKNFVLGKLYFFLVIMTNIFRVSNSSGHKNVINILLINSSFVIFLEVLAYYLYWEKILVSKLMDYTKSNRHFYLMRYMNYLLPGFIVDKLLTPELTRKDVEENGAQESMRRKKTSQPIKRFDQMKFLADDAGCINILFCKICGIDLNREDSPGLLDEIYSDFDKLCKRLGVQKIETVEKIYMASSGLQLYEKKIDPKLSAIKPEDRIFDVALEMHKYIAEFDSSKTDIKIKIGMHRGNCIYGFFGDHKPQFSLIGDTVNTTSRHCKVAQPGQIVLSKQFYSSFSNTMNIIFKSDMKYMKGKGNIKYYMHCPLKDYNVELDQNPQTNEKSRKAKISRFKFRFFNKSKKKIDSKGFCRRFMSSFCRATGRIVKRICKSGQKSKRNQILNQNARLRKEKKHQNQTIEMITTYKVSSFILLLLNSLMLGYYVTYKNFGWNNINLILLLVYVVCTVLFFMLFKNRSHKKLMLGLKWTAIVGFNFIFIGLITTHFFWQYQEIGDYLEYILMGAFLHFEFLKMMSRNSLILQNVMMTGIFLIVNAYFGLILYFMSQKSEEEMLREYRVHSHQFTNWHLNPHFDRASLSRANFFEFVMLKCIMSNLVIVLKLFENVKMHLNLKQHSKKEKEQSMVSENILQELLPRHVSFEMLKYGLHRTERLKKVTLLFADIAGFTAFSAKNQPRAVIGMLQRLFTNFDRKCKQLGLYKVCTIGDCYVTMSFTDKRNRGKMSEEAVKTVQLGLDMIEVITKVQREIDYKGLNMRIGIHTGDVYGRVMGFDLIRYDLFGPHVSLANEIEAEGLNNQIHVSDSTKQLILNSKSSHLYSFKDHKTLNVAGIKNVKTYIINTVV